MARRGRDNIAEKQPPTPGTLLPQSYNAPLPSPPTNMRYTAYNLTIFSELALPELVPLPPTDPLPEAATHVHIKLATIHPHGLPDGRQLGPFLWANPDSLWLQIPKVARFLIQGGQTILIDPEPGIDEDSVRVFLLGSALGALLFQRGYLVLHGNAIRVGNQCMVCVGHSGAGKSTLAAGFMQRGHQVLADDVVPVDAQCRALPGFPRIKLWQDVADKLTISTDSLHRIRPSLDKFNYPLPLQPDQTPLPIRWVYMLGSDHANAITLEPIQGMKRFAPLRANTYRARYMEGMALKAQHLQLCGQLAGTIRLARVTRPRQGFELDALIDHLLADMAAHP